MIDYYARIEQSLRNISRYRREKDAILEAFRLSDREHSYASIRDRLFKEIAEDYE